MTTQVDSLLFLVNGALADAYAEIERQWARVAELEAGRTDDRETIRALRVAVVQMDMVVRELRIRETALAASAGVIAAEAERLRYERTGGIVILRPPPGEWRN